MILAYWFFSPDKVILFLSDGKPTDRGNLVEAEEEIVRTIKGENAQLNNSVIIKMYGIGQNEGEYSWVWQSLKLNKIGQNACECRLVYGAPVFLSAN